MGIRSTSVFKVPLLLLNWITTLESTLPTRPQTGITSIPFPGCPTGVTTVSNSSRRGRNKISIEASHRCNGWNTFDLLIKMPRWILGSPSTMRRSCQPLKAA
ncbi:hypothetical protein BJY00DRAFT_292081 [Aspergillus carlsbadensis]|nr:hypothetical protein BJY00DRAFT_292081 [Aspergillus carlsbadensis]